MSHVTLKIEFAALAHNTPIPTYTHMCTCNIYVWKLTAYLSVFQISCEHIAFDCIHVSDILHSCVGLDVSQTHQVHVFMLMCLRHIKFTHVTWLIFYPWHDLFIHTCDMTHSYLSHDLFIRMIWPLPKQLELLGATWRMPKWRVLDCISTMCSSNSHEANCRYSGAEFWDYFWKTWI